MTALLDMKVFNTQLQTAIIKKLTQKTDLFTTASGIALINEAMMGDFKEEAIWNNVSDALRDVDANAAQATVTATGLSQDQINDVKTMKAFGPITWEPNQLSWIGKNPGEALSVISESLSMAVMQDQVNKAIGVLVAAISNQAGAFLDVSADAGVLGAVSQINLNKSHALFSDASQNLTTQIMFGTTAHKLIGQALDNGDVLFREGTVRVIDILGKRTVITDSPALTAGAKERVLTLQPMAATIASNNDFRSSIVEGTGKTRLETTYQAEYTENVSVKGYSWNTAVKSPVKAQLETGTNWTLIMPLKESAGVLLIGDPAKGE
ncbi:major capsid protein [Porticoccaceae bacterium]|nr:major capsid protein [Porticoccaceae bacterium]